VITVDGNICSGKGMLAKGIAETLGMNQCCAECCLFLRQVVADSTLILLWYWLGRTGPKVSILHFWNVYWKTCFESFRIRKKFQKSIPVVILNWHLVQAEHFHMSCLMWTLWRLPTPRELLLLLFFTLEYLGRSEDATQLAVTTCFWLFVQMFVHFVFLWHLRGSSCGHGSSPGRNSHKGTGNL
jgi:hypothetical protein